MEQHTQRHASKIDDYHTAKVLRSLAESGDWGDKQPLSVHMQPCPGIQSGRMSAFWLTADIGREEQTTATKFFMMRVIKCI